MKDKELIKRLVISNEGCYACCKNAYFVRHVGMSCDFDDECCRDTKYPKFKLNREVIEKIYEHY